MLPEAEREAATFIERNIGNLESFVQDFESSNRLFDHCESLKIPVPTRREDVMSGLRARADANLLLARWKGMAARNGALTLYDFFQTQRSTDTLASRCPTLSKHFDRERQGQSNKAFVAAFRDFGAVRQGAAHRGEHAATPEEFARNVGDDSLVVDGIKILQTGSLFISGTLFNRHYHFTVKGKHVSYELSAKSVSALKEVLELLKSALAPAAEFMERSYLDQTRENGERPNPN